MPQKSNASKKATNASLSRKRYKNNSDDENENSNQPVDNDYSNDISSQSLPNSSNESEYFPSQNSQVFFNRLINSKSNKSNRNHNRFFFDILIIAIFNYFYFFQNRIIIEYFVILVLACKLQ